MVRMLTAIAALIVASSTLAQEATPEPTPAPKGWTLEQSATSKMTDFETLAVSNTASDKGETVTMTVSCVIHPKAKYPQVRFQLSTPHAIVGEPIFTFASYRGVFRCPTPGCPIPDSVHKGHGKPIVWVRFGKEKPRKFTIVQSEPFDNVSLWDGRELRDFITGLSTHDEITLSTYHSYSENAEPTFDTSGFETVAAPLFEKCPSLRR